MSGCGVKAEASGLHQVHFKLNDPSSHLHWLGFVRVLVSHLLLLSLSLSFVCAATKLGPLLVPLA